MRDNATFLPRDILRKNFEVLVQLETPAECKNAHNDVR